MRSASRAWVPGLLLAGCLQSGMPSEPEGLQCAPSGRYMGAFYGTAAGSVSDTLVGCAYMGIFTNPPRGLYNSTITTAMILSNGPMGNFAQTIGIFKWGPRPYEGTYTVGPPEVGGIYGQILVAQGNRTFTITSGSLTIDNNWDHGSVNLVATEVGGSATITVSGTFAARCLEALPPPSDDDHVDRSRPILCGGEAPR